MLRMFVFLILTLTASSCFAEGLFYDSCIDTAFNPRAESDLLIYTAYQGGAMGLTCQDLKSLKGAYEATSLALYPATLAMILTPARAQILAELELLGLTMMNPVVLGVTVIGAVGGVTVYFVLKASLDECERMDQARLKEEIIREMEQKYGLDARRATLEFKKR